MRLKLPPQKYNAFFFLHPFHLPQFQNHKRAKNWTHPCNSSWTFFLVLVKGVLSLASTAVALTLFYGLKSTLPFGPFLSWSCCSCNGAKAAGTRASALKKERSTFEASSPFMHGPRGTTALTAIEGPGQLHNHHTEEPDLQTTTIRHLTHFDAFREKWCFSESPKVLIGFSNHGQKFILQLNQES